jgi:CubicO group peptidase (beta-lactamase class C family)
MADVMRGYVEREEVAGVVTLLARGNEVHVETAGTLELRAGAPVARDSIFRIASMTKPIAAVAALMLVEETRLRLDDPVTELIPELADRRVLRDVEGPLEETEPAHRPITLRDLLTFRMGFGVLMTPPDRFPIQRATSAVDLGAGPTPSPYAPDEWMRRFATLPLMCQPGTRWLYHTAFDVLSILIERAAGMPFAQFLAERIFEPLGMRDTGFRVPPAQHARLAACYRTDSRTGALVPYTDGRGAGPDGHEVVASGSTGLVSTVDDYLAFGRMLLRFGQHGATRLLARPTVEAMTTDQLTREEKAISPFFPGFWDDHGWGFGVAMITRRSSGAAVPGRFGWDGGFGTSWCSDPREDLVGILMTQRFYDEVALRVRDDFWTLTYQAIDD